MIFEDRLFFRKDAQAILVELRKFGIKSNVCKLKNDAYYFVEADEDARIWSSISGADIEVHDWALLDKSKKCKISFMPSAEKALKRLIIMNYD